MSLIDRGKVMNDYLENLGRADSYKAKYEALVKAVDEAPAVDAEPVRHGRWIENDGVWKNGTTGERVTLLQASCCGSYYMYGPYKHCPNCGAKMDGGAKDA